MYQLSFCHVIRFVSLIMTDEGILLIKVVALEIIQTFRFKTTHFVEVHQRHCLS
jgi:hypothetical protein